jgi:hypothetical protein
MRGKAEMIREIGIKRRDHESGTRSRDDEIDGLGSDVRLRQAVSNDLFSQSARGVLIELARLSE